MPDAPDINQHSPDLIEANQDGCRAVYVVALPVLTYVYMILYILGRHQRPARDMIASQDAG